MVSGSGDYLDLIAGGVVVGRGLVVGQGQLGRSREAVAAVDIQSEALGSDVSDEAGDDVADAVVEGIVGRLAGIAGGLAWGCSCWEVSVG